MVLQHLSAEVEMTDNNQKEIVFSIERATEIRNQTCAVDYGLSIEEARAEYDNPVSFMATAQRLVDEVKATPGWGDRRPSSGDAPAETPEEHGQRLKRYHHALDVVATPTDPNDLEWAKRRAEAIWAKVTSPLELQRHAHAHARTSLSAYRRETGRDAPVGLDNAIHRAIEDIRAKEAANLGVPESRLPGLQTAKDARARALAALERGGEMADAAEQADLQRQMAINHSRERIREVAPSQESQDAPDDSL